jgi:hypothetical protein
MAAVSGLKGNRRIRGRMLMPAVAELLCQRCGARTEGVIADRAWRVELSGADALELGIAWRDKELDPRGHGSRSGSPKESAEPATAWTTTRAPGGEGSQVSY